MNNAFAKRNHESCGPGTGSPYALGDDEAYLRWREWKLGNQPASADELVVEVGDAASLTAGEHGALLDRLCRTNVAIYAARRITADPETVVSALAGAFGLRQMDAHLCAEEDTVTPLSAVRDGRRKRYIPYTDRPINWHTDGYYNQPHQRVRAFILHCVRAAKSGGENALMDPEIAYIRVRDENPDLLAALARDDAMTIPPNKEAGTEIRGSRPGPVFWIDERDGTLGMRYTARTRSISWRDDRMTTVAAGKLRQVMEAEAPDVLRYRLGPGHGILANNVLHNRIGFTDPDNAGEGRLVYRGRFYDRISGTSLADTWPREQRT